MLRNEIYEKLQQYHHFDEDGDYHPVVQVVAPARLATNDTVQVDAENATIFFSSVGGAFPVNENEIMDAVLAAARTLMAHGIEHFDVVDMRGFVLGTDPELELQYNVMCHWKWYHF